MHILTENLSRYPIRICRENGVFSSFIRRISLLSARLSWKISRDFMTISKRRVRDLFRILRYPLCAQAWHDSSEKIGKVTYPMIGDPTAQLAKDLDVYIEADGMTERGTFVINPDGEVVLYEISAGNIGRNADELLRKVRAAKFVYEHGDEVCPAKWEPGAATLKPSFDLVGKL